MAARRTCFVRAGTMPGHAEAALDPNVTFVFIVGALAANELFSAEFEGVRKAHCQVQVSTSLHGADWHTMDGPDTLASRFEGDAPLWIRVILPPPIGEL